MTHNDPHPANANEGIYDLAKYRSGDLIVDHKAKKCAGEHSDDAGSDHREIRKALIAAEMTGLELLGFVFYGENIHQGRYYSKRAQRGYQYYNKYDTRIQANSSKLSQNENRKLETRNNRRGRKD